MTTARMTGDGTEVVGSLPSAPGGSRVSLELRSLEKSYAAVRAVAGIDLVTTPGEFITLLGPSGSGKSTTLNLIAGFLRPDRGDVLIDGVSIAQTPPHRRNLGVVFQDYLLFPHMTAQRNIAFPLRRRKIPSAEVRKMVDEALELVGLQGMGDRYPRQLSGGQQQRVALARAIVFRPPLLLMDEPLGALDRNLRESLQLEIKRIHRELGVTFLYVTHDQDEALVLSDRIAVFNEGHIEQVAAPDEIYERPKTTFVASFVGDSNIFRGDLTGDGATSRVLRMPDGRTILPPVEEPGTDAAVVLVRPEKMRLEAADLPNRLSGTIAEVVYLGSNLKVVVAVEGIGDVVVSESPSVVSSLRLGDPVVVSWRPEDSVWVAAS